MKKGDLPISTLVAILIGIIVLTIVIYLMFFYSKKSSLYCRLCSSKFANWCQRCATTKDNWNRPTWPNDVEMEKDLNDCMQECLRITPNICNSLRDECKAYLPNITGIF